MYYRLLEKLKDYDLPYVLKTAAPGTTDIGQVPTLWVDTTNNAVYILIDVTGGVATWVLSSVGGAIVTKTGAFPAFDAAESQVLNITGISNNNPVVRQVRLWFKDADDPGADANVNCRLSFYNKDELTEDQLICDFYFNLVYTEVKVETAGTDETADIDSTAGLVAYDLIRFTEGTPENVRITAVTDADTVACTAIAGVHAVDEGVVRVAEITEMFQLYDADSSNEIHAKLEMLSDPGTDVQVTIEVDIQ